MIFKYELINNKGETISRHKSLDKAMQAQKYCKTCLPTIKPIKGN